jgi:FKBP-type peptidyl-prolyl cis-trans isomerase
MKSVRYLETVKLSKDDGVIKKIIKRGEQVGEDAIPLPGQEVTVNYTCRLEDGTIVDRSEEHVAKTGEPIRFTVGMGNVVEGWDMALMTMCLGEKADIFLSSQYAFGSEGRPPKIKPDTNVIFNVELIQIGERKCKNYSREKRPDSTLLAESMLQKQEGNDCFKKK